MSFVTTRPEALLAAASRLEGLGSSMTTQNTAAVTPTTAVAPAAADPVSALQAALFSAYGDLYQSVSAQAAAIHQMLVSTLGTNAGSYGLTEMANQVATSVTPAQSLPGLSSADSVAGTPIGWAQNFPAAASDMFALAPGWATAPKTADAALGAGLTADVGATPPAAAVAPAGAATSGGAAVLASSGGASSIGKLSVPPSWAAGGAPVASTAPVTLTGADWTAAAPHPSQVTAMPAGVPSVASTGRGGLGLGAPRYGAKPTVMPKPTVV
ncbi:PPE family protein, SVP subgroup [Mycobacterium sp.]|uniref:PPE family protein, SVP subgroup n=1 Tax=Mycobacterium sp. TaxID=1785 RepID=UPI003F970FCF